MNFQNILPQFFDHLGVPPMLLTAAGFFDQSQDVVELGCLFGGESILAICLLNLFIQYGCTLLAFLQPSVELFHLDQDPALEADKLLHLQPISALRLKRDPRVEIACGVIAGTRGVDGVLLGYVLPNLHAHFAGNVCTGINRHALVVLTLTVLLQVV